MRHISLLGSTGSIGTNALEIIEKFPNKFLVDGLTAHTNIKKLSDQINKFNPKIVAVSDELCAINLEKLISSNSNRTKIVFGDSGYIQVAVNPESDIVLNAIVGAAGLMPTLAAIDAGKDVALANKETLVMAGEIVMDRVAKNKINLIPVDSEHSAIYQCLLGHSKNDLKSILLTASGGPFLNMPSKLFSDITIESALKHPKWSMGNKITIDSATLMNKALEIIEAKWLFNVPIDKIKVLIHPQSIVHSMVSYKDGTIIGQMGIPDMKAAIAYGLTFPKRLDIGINEPDFLNIGELSFEAPNFKKFPCLGLAFLVSEIGGVMPAVMNAANEVAVKGFLDGLIPFTKIYFIVKKTIDSYCPNDASSIDDIINADFRARIIATDLINK